MLGIIQQLGAAWHGSKLVLLDKQDLPNKTRPEQFANVGWIAEFRQGDMFTPKEVWDHEFYGTITANLVLHHFLEEDLRTLFSVLAPRTQAFIALEPRRSRAALAASRLVGLLGCNAVTRHDAPASVRAGFRGCELSKLWPAGRDWRLKEHRNGFFSHLFVAERRLAQ
jgi:hypothetical protein